MKPGFIVFDTDAVYNIGDLSDVVITTIADGELLMWDTGTSKWINQTSDELGFVKDTGDDMTGQLTFSGDGRVTVDMYISAAGVKAPGTFKATLAELGLTSVWVFSDADPNEESISGTLKLPSQMDKTVVPSFKIGWSANGVSPGDCDWQLEYLYISPNEATDASAQETLHQASTASATSHGFNITTITGLDLPSATDQAMFFRITRLSAAGSGDTIAASVYLRGCLFTHTRNKLGTAV